MLNTSRATCEQRCKHNQLCTPHLASRIPHIALAVAGLTRLDTNRSCLATQNKQHRDGDGRAPTRCIVALRSPERAVSRRWGTMADVRDPAAPGATQVGRPIVAAAASTPVSEPVVAATIVAQSRAAPRAAVGAADQTMPALDLAIGQTMPAGSARSVSVGATTRYAQTGRPRTIASSCLSMRSTTSSATRSPAAGWAGSCRRAIAASGGTVGDQGAADPIRRSARALRARDAASPRRLQHPGIVTSREAGDGRPASRST